MLYQFGTKYSFESFKVWISRRSLSKNFLDARWFYTLATTTNKFWCVLSSSLRNQNWLRAIWLAALTREKASMLHAMQITWNTCIWRKIMLETQALTTGTSFSEWWNWLNTSFTYYCKLSFQKSNTWRDATIFINYNCHEISDWSSVF